MYNTAGMSLVLPEGSVQFLKPQVKWIPEKVMMDFQVDDHVSARQRGMISEAEE